MNFGKIDDLFVSKVEAAVGSHNVFTDIYDTLPYARDNYPCRWSTEFAFRPDVVVTPESTEHVAAVVGLANENLRAGNLAFSHYYFIVQKKNLAPYQWIKVASSEKLSYRAMRERVACCVCATILPR